MKRIVILCDGTWNTAGAPKPTNVVRLAQALMPVDSEDITQVPIYIPGVGTGRRGVTRLGRWSDRLLGGSLGLGFDENVVEAYQHLIFLYEPGDEIFIFGFSRGAFTAWSLAGFLRSSGLLDRASLDRLPKAVEWYRDQARRRLHPDDPAVQAHRLSLSPYLMTGEADRVYYRERGYPDAMMLRVEYLGLWDTVSALGVPDLLAGKTVLRSVDMSTIVGRWRHALGLDERRVTHSAEVFQAPPGTAADAAQVWFPGDHRSVGGGGPGTELSSITLSWIIEGAEAAGLAFDPGLLARFEAEHDPFGRLLNSKPEPPRLLDRVLHLVSRDRPGPEESGQLHPCVLDRYAVAVAPDRPYRPGSLRRIEADLRTMLANREVSSAGDDRTVT